MKGRGAVFKAEQSIDQVVKAKGKLFKVDSSISQLPKVER